ncbi:2Fe-2S iron-sulfur cluster-binding protein [Streptomyces adonidis]|uniref:2Fe-2S iron-sulfur cluster-binding protein n=1 Tax=Streptomyces adonidis TaxID=3231367 RepID=UPI0034DAEC3E
MIIVHDRKDVRHEFDVPEGKALMLQLRPKKIGIIGLCNGNAACGTCHVYVEKEWLDRLPEPDEYESEMLEEVAERRENSRLACQIEYRAELDGLEMTVAHRS